jgi:hypothetical protein
MLRPERRARYSSGAIRCSAALDQKLPPLTVLMSVSPAAAILCAVSSAPFQVAELASGDQVCERPRQRSNGS